MNSSLIRSSGLPVAAICLFIVLELHALPAAAAILAMIPLSRQVFWGPMAVCIMGGLAVATLLTCLFLPALYAAGYRVRKEDVA